VLTSCLTEAPSLNETFCRALLRAGLTEDDIAARLDVDPKTVRRWIEGRALPYRRHRWTLAALLGVAETDLWPQLRSTQARPQEVAAVYPHLGTVPGEMWLRLFSSAQDDISLLDPLRLPHVDDREVTATLADRARAGVAIRICLADPAVPDAIAGLGMAAPTANVGSALERYAPLRDIGQASIRLHQGASYNCIYRVDDQLLVAQRAYGVPDVQAPVLHLQRADGGDMFTVYIESFERTWADARPVNWPN
jgi:transcriptional regulator with XRE-family HTH domain